MKLSVNKVLAASLIFTSVIITGCVDSEKDFFDPSYKTDNPMGNISAPEDFDWSLLSTINLTVNVKDEFNGEYYYTLEVYSSNPLYDPNAALLSKGVSKKGQPFKKDISIQKSVNNIYIKQIDPRKREEVYPFIISESTKELTCNLFYINDATRAIATNQAATTTYMEMPDYTKIPEDAVDISEATSETGLNKANYKMTGIFTGTFPTYSAKNTKIYISGTWKINQNQQNISSETEIIVMNGGKITADKSFAFNNNSMLTIMPGGVVEGNDLTFTNDKPAAVRNWGSITIFDKFKLASGATLFNKGEINSNNLEINSNSNVINEGNITISNDVELPSNVNLNNSGILKGKNCTANSQGTITNSNTLLFETISWTNPTIYNSCTIEATSSFYVNGCKIYLDKGYIKAQTMDLGGAEVELKNGSMLEATETISHRSQANNYKGVGTNLSLIKAPKIIAAQSGNTGSAIYQGNLNIEADNHTENEKYKIYYTVENGASIVKLGQSKAIIEVCTGIVNPGNPGTETPTDPDFPIEVPNSNIYTYIFEDQWPLYGDYDMNDVVFQISGITQSINSKNEIERLKFNLTVQAVGASKKIGIAMQLDEVFNELVDNSSYPSAENGTGKAVFPIVDDAHLLLAGLDGQDKRFFINTLKGGGSWPAKTIPMDIRFKNGVTASNTDISKLNFFIITEERPEGRKEIHLPGYPATDKANPIYFNSGNDNSRGIRSYTSPENLAWGILIPGEFNWPQEYVNIKEAYRLFEGWISSGGANNGDWTSNDIDASKIY